MGVLVFKHLRVFSIFFLFGIPIIGLAQTPLNDHSWDNVFDDNFETLNTTRWYHNNHVHGTGSDEDAYAYMNDNAYVNGKSARRFSSSWEWPMCIPWRKTLLQIWNNTELPSI